MIRTCPRTVTADGRSTGRCCGWTGSAVCGQPAPYAALLDLLGSLSEHLRCVEHAADLRRDNASLLVSIKTVRHR